MASHMGFAFSADIEGRQKPPQCLPGKVAGIKAVDIQEEVVEISRELKVTSFLVDHGSFIRV